MTLEPEVCSGQLALAQAQAQAREDTIEHTRG
jgi:hypothetical protein